MRLSAGLLALVMMAGASGPVAADQDDEIPNIAGSWTFTARVDPTCTFGGTAHLQQTSPGRFQCELTARQSCSGLPEDYLVRQTCEASILGNQVSVRSQIVEFLNGFESPFYYPDNFTLTIRSDTFMYGALISAGGRRPSEWRRSEEGVS